MSWEPISKTLGSVIDERLSSPLISTFAISWSLINYKFFVLLLSKTPAVETFAQIKAHVFPDAWAYALNGVLYPAIATAVYLFALPKPARWVFEKWRANQKLTDDIRKRYDDLQPLSHEESTAYRRRYRELDEQHENDQRTIEQLRLDLKKAEAELKDLPNKLRTDDTHTWKNEYEKMEQQYLEGEMQREHLRTEIDRLKRPTEGPMQQMFGSRMHLANLRLFQSLQLAGVVPSELDFDRFQVLDAIGMLGVPSLSQLRIHFPTTEDVWLDEKLRALKEKGYIHHKVGKSDLAGQSTFEVTNKARNLLDSVERWVLTQSRSG